MFVQFIAVSIGSLSLYHCDRIIYIFDKNDIFLHQISFSHFLNCCDFMQQCVMP